MRFFGFLSGLLALALAATLVGTMRQPPPFTWRPSGYLAGVDSLVVRPGLLFLVQAGDTIPGTRQVASQDTLIFDSGSASQAVRLFYEQSRLAEDVRRFNEDPIAPISPFVIVNGVVRGINPDFHTVLMPTAPHRGWSGEVRVRAQERGATLYDEQGMEIRVLKPASGATRGTERRVRVFQQPQIVSGTVFDLVANDQPFGQVFMIGESPVYQIRTNKEQRDDQVWLNGRLLRTGEGELRRLENGDWLQAQVRSPARGYDQRVLTVDLEQRHTSASFMRIRGPGPADRERLYPIEDLRSVLEPFASAMTRSLSARAEQGLGTRDVGALDVQMGIDLETSEALVRTLRIVCDSIHVRSTRPKGLSLTVMDAFTGEVRALPSCPDDAILQRYPSIPEATRNRLSRNQNLVSHPVGSALKPFWAAAMASMYPTLLDLEVYGVSGREVTDVLGCTVAGYDNSHGRADWIKLEEFIQHSSNYYLVQMASLGIVLGRAEQAHPGICSGGTDPNRIATCLPPRTGRPSRLRLGDGSVPIEAILAGVPQGPTCQQVTSLHRLWAPQENFRALTNGLVLGNPGTGTRNNPLQGWEEQGYHLEVWDPVLQALTSGARGPDSMVLRRPFMDVSPPRANLKLDLVNDLRTQWVSMLLGGEKSRWTNVSLTAAMARLMTGRDVTPLLATSPQAATRPATQRLTERMLHPGVRRRVLHAMELVVEGGTAAALSDNVQNLRTAFDQAAGADRVEVYVFAKTGTPTVPVYPQTQAIQPYQQLLAAGLRWNSVSRAFERPGYVQRLLARMPDQADLLDRIERDPDDYVYAPDTDPHVPALLYFDRAGNLQVAQFGQAVRNNGAALIVGLLAVPKQTQGRSRSSQEPDWVSNYADDGLWRRINEIPPVGLLNPATAVGITIAIYQDDLPRPATSEHAVRLMERVFPEIQDLMIREWLRKNPR
ncbi:hypothetical protein [Longimicrobium sp.]|uniref:hypothetical protein n=1 Tax=Longimicrobium sp. TaxID=2029185 RepID=UPI002E30B1C6|nr:hypothetical protein [Longimicrobium sp.]HEX6040702.1 hypothetical protein [Longimicrobium sp.]